MKKVLFFALALLCVSAAFGQGKPRVAVYVTGDAEPNVKKVVAQKLISAVTKSEEYLGVERMKEFLAELDKEHAYQRSGAVDDRHIIAVGKKWGANFVCIAEASKLYGSIVVSARLVRVITGEIAVTAEADKVVSNMADLNEVAGAVAEELFDVVLPKTSLGGSTSAGTPYNPAGMQLGGVTWASVNVDDYQTFARRPDMYTKFYQWNRSKAWAATGENVNGWSSGNIYDATWTVNPCPAGWRLPTYEEYDALLYTTGSTWAAANARGNAVAGRFFGSNHVSCTLPNNMTGCIFLPAVSARGYSDGSLVGQGTSGYYWRSLQNQDFNGLAYCLYFNSTESKPGSGAKANGFSIRCVSGGQSQDAVDFASSCRVTVAKSNLSNKHYWVDAKTACPAGWRLPTKDELECMCESGKVAGMFKSGESYWSSTWANSNGGFNRYYYVFYSGGDCYSREGFDEYYHFEGLGKVDTEKDKRYVRCVK